MTSPVNNPDEPSVSDPYAALPAARRPVDNVPPFGKPPKGKKRGRDPNKPPRDKRWFLRIVGWIVFAVGATIFALGAMPSERQVINPGSIISTAQMMMLASFTFLSFGGFLLWWGYGKIGEPLVACKQCLHFNKPRSSECKKCGNQLG